MRKFSWAEPLATSSASVTASAASSHRDRLGCSLLVAVMTGRSRVTARVAPVNALRGQEPDDGEAPLVQVRVHMRGAPSLTTRGRTSRGAPAPPVQDDGDRVDLGE